MKAVRIFNPLHDKISVSDIDGLKVFKLYEHPEIRALADSIKSFEEKNDRKGKDTFDLPDWRKSNCATLPAFTNVFRAVLTNSSLNSSNSCPSESLFSIFNETYNDDQEKSHTDYIQSSMQRHSLTNERCSSRVSR
jgi:hypothetical protein